MKQQIAADPDDEPSAGNAAPAPDALQRYSPAPKDVGHAMNPAPDGQWMRVSQHEQIVDAQAREIAAHGRRIAAMNEAYVSVRSLNGTLIDKLDRAEADLAAARADAERYRHIRPMFRAFSVHIDGNHSWVATGELGRMRGPSLDAAIDAARSAARKGDV